MERKRERSKRGREQRERRRERRRGLAQFYDKARKKNNNIGLED